MRYKIYIHGDLSWLGLVWKFGVSILVANRQCYIRPLEYFRSGCKLILVNINCSCNGRSAVMLMVIVTTTEISRETINIMIGKDWLAETRYLLLWRKTLFLNILLTYLHWQFTALRQTELYLYIQGVLPKKGEVGSRSI